MTVLSVLALSSDQGTETHHEQTGGALPSFARWCSFECSSSQGSSARNRDGPEFRPTIFVNFKDVRMAHAVRPSQGTEHAKALIERIGQGNKLSNIASDRNHPRVVSDSIKNQGSLSILDSKYAIFIFV